MREAGGARGIVVLCRRQRSACAGLSRLLRVATFAFVVSASLVHFLLSLPQLFMPAHAMEIPVGLKRVGGAGYVVVAVLHLSAIASMVSRSIRGNSSSFVRCIRSKLRPVTSSSSLEGTVVGRIWSVPLRLVRQLTSMRSLQSLLPISSLCRESVEIVMQTYQLWALSHYVSRQEAPTPSETCNHFAVATVMTTSCSIPLVNGLVHKNEGIRRLKRLVIDRHLDFICAVVVPDPLLYRVSWGLTGKRTFSR